MLLGDTSILLWTAQRRNNIQLRNARGRIYMAKLHPARPATVYCCGTRTSTTIYCRGTRTPQ
eukprot:11188668-Lingulodinium_polyedra.AAC.1